MSEFNEESYYETIKDTSTELTLSAVRDFLTSRGGKCKYSELFDHFRNVITDSITGRI
jgi:hypothetical protein